MYNLLRVIIFSKLNHKISEIVPTLERHKKGKSTNRQSGLLEKFSSEDYSLSSASLFPQKKYCFFFVGQLVEL